MVVHAPAFMRVATTGALITGYFVSSELTTMDGSTTATATTCEQMPIRQGFGNRSESDTMANCAIANFPLPAAPDPATVCRAACCENGACRSWGLDLRHPGNSAGCTDGKPCCWLERCNGLALEHLTNCSWGCVSGQAGRADDPKQCSTCTATECAKCEGPPPPGPPACSAHTTAATCSLWGCLWNRTCSCCNDPPPPAPPPPVISVELECKLRSLILRWAKTLQPERAALTDNMSTLFDALRLGESPDGMPACNFSRAAADEFEPIELEYRLPALDIVPRAHPARDTIVVYVSANAGDDDNDGSESKPLRSLSAARDWVRRLRRARGSADATPVMAEVRMTGTFYLQETLELSYLDGNTRWMSTAGSDATISGGRRLEGLIWTNTKVNGHSIYSTNLPGNTAHFDTLFDGSKNSRLVRARFPNGNLERDMRPNGWISSELDPGRLSSTSRSLIVAFASDCVIIVVSNVQVFNGRLTPIRNGNHRHTRYRANGCKSSLAGGTIRSSVFFKRMERVLHFLQQQER